MCVVCVWLVHYVTNKWISVFRLSGEWQLCEKGYANNIILNICLFVYF